MEGADREERDKCAEAEKNNNKTEEKKKSEQESKVRANIQGMHLNFAKM